MKNIGIGIIANNLLGWWNKSNGIGLGFSLSYKM